MPPISCARPIGWGKRVTWGCTFLWLVSQEPESRGLKAPSLSGSPAGRGHLSPLATWALGNLSRREPCGLWAYKPLWPLGMRKGSHQGMYPPV